MIGRVKMIRYRSVKKEASVEQIVEKSRFIAYVRPVETREEAWSFSMKYEIA